MNRSPLFYPLSRGMDAEGGGAAELQTDVMRFMAIISLCLVAIFALVQSMPLMPELPPVPDPIEETIIEQPPEPANTREQTPEPADRTPEPVVRLIPVPEPIPVLEPVPEPVPKTKSSPAAESTPPAPSPVVEKPDIKGFTLRFENDPALTNLVAANEIGLFAIAPDKALSMEMNHGRISFSRADTPGQFHEMEQSTVPESVLNAFRRTASLPPSAVKWGVTLSPAMTRSLNQHLGQHEGGRLTIHADGKLRLEQ